MLDSAFRQWLDANAEAIDQGQCDPHQVLAHIAESQLLRVGVAAELGGSGGEVSDGVEAIAAIANRSLAAAFVCWGQRAFIEYLLHSPNQALRERLLPSLLKGELAGATGLSNAMKFLSGIEALQVRGRPQAEGGPRRPPALGDKPAQVRLRGGCRHRVRCRWCAVRAGHSV